MWSRRQLQKLQETYRVREGKARKTSREPQKSANLRGEMRGDERRGDEKKLDLLFCATILHIAR